MKWAYGIKNKLSAALVLLLVFGLVFLNNIKEWHNSHRLKKTFSAMYEDRLMAESYILDLSESLHAIIEITENEHYSIREKDDLLNSVTAGIDKLNAVYGETKLTREEELKFNKFLYLCDQIHEDIHSHDYLGGKTHSKEALAVLNTLSMIQLSEAKSLMREAESLFSSGEISFQFEIAILIILGLIIQALIFSSNSLNVHPIIRKPNLN